MAEERVRTCAVTGHVCLDVMPGLHDGVDLRPGALFEVGRLLLRPGGCVANTGLGLADLGAPVCLSGDIGDDDVGVLLRDALARHGADAAGLHVQSGIGTSYSIVVERPGEDRCFWHHVGANERYDGTLAEDAGTSTDLVHLGYPTILPRLYADGGALLARALRAAREAGATTSIDLATVDAESPAQIEDWPALLARTLEDVDVFAPSLDDLASLQFEATSSVAAVRRLAGWAIERGAGVVMLKAGERGLYMRTADATRLGSGGRALAPVADAWADRELWLPSALVKVVATTGAGDAAVAGLLYGIAAGWDPTRALRLAGAAAAWRVSRQSPLPAADDVIQAIDRYSAFGAPGWEQRQDGVAFGPADRDARQGADVKC